MSRDFAALWKFLTSQWPRQSGGYYAPGDHPPLIPWRWLISGVLLLTLLSYLCILSFSFDADVPPADQPIVVTVIVLILAGLTFMYMVELCRFVRPGMGVLLWIVTVGLIMRLLMLFSTPVLEVDFYRYQWDGAVTANGINPYLFAPQEVAGDSLDQPDIRRAFDQLLAESDHIVNKINHGHLRSIYPLVAQAGFATAYWLSPWQLIGWQIVLLFCEMTTAVLLLMLLWKTGCSPVWLSVYWLNPLVVKEMLNSAHMDALLFPFLLAATIAHIGNRGYRAMAFLALATAVKVWPLLLLPVFLRQYWPNWRQVLPKMLWFGGLVAALFLPVVLAGLEGDSGFAAYSQKWQLNDSLFRLILWTAQGILPLVKVHPGHGQSVARAVAAVLVLAVVVYSSWRRAESSHDFIQRLLWPVAALFMLSPTQFPWYAVWLMPFLVLVPRHSLILLSVLMPLYYLRYWFEAHGTVSVFDNYIVWLQFLPVWWLLWREKTSRREIDNRLTPRPIID